MAIVHVKRAKVNINGRLLDRAAQVARAKKMDALRATYQRARLQTQKQQTRDNWDNDDTDFADASGSLGDNIDWVDDDRTDGPTDASTELCDEYLRYTGLPRTRFREWGHRRRQEHINWAAQLEDLVCAYLKARHDSDLSFADAAEPGGPALLNMTLVDVFQYKVVDVPHAHAWVNVSLIYAGYLGSAPINPRCAFSLRALQLYKSLKARGFVSRQAFVRVLCDMHRVAYNKSITHMFTCAYNAYSAIQRAIQEKLKTALGRTGDWRIKNRCPCCSYECQEEPELIFSRQLAMDGNNSLKRFLFASAPGDFTFPSQYILPSAIVDQWAHEVASSRRPRSTPEEEPTEEGSLDDPAGDSDPSVCTDRWRAARDDRHKTACKAFDETGVFICICRHGFVLIGADMKQSGELAKYPLAILKKILDTLGYDIEFAYDIGCSFDQTVQNSSLSVQAATQRVRFVVGSFHGHAHNRLCQHGYHPRHVAGSGREDFECPERLFQTTNRLASFTRYSSAYNRLADIDDALTTWDMEKYANLGEFLFKNYRDALGKIDEHRSMVQHAREDLGFDDNVVQTLLSEEFNYLKLQKKTVVSEHAVTVQAYAAALQRFWKAQEEVQALNVPFSIEYRAPGNEDSVDRRWHRAVSKRRDELDALEALETKLGIEYRWTPFSVEYTDALKSVSIREYEQALDDLERLVVRRFFEMEKVNARGTGYKLRVQIAKGLSARASAIRTALAKHNACAAKLQPPRPSLDYKQVADLVFLDDFALLRESREAVLEQRWAQPLVRRAIVAWQETKRAKEELVRVGVEARRLRAWMRDEEQYLQDRTRYLAARDSETDQFLAFELWQQAELTNDLNQGSRKFLDKLDVLLGRRDSEVPLAKSSSHFPPMNPEPLHADGDISSLRSALTTRNIPDIMRNGHESDDDDEPDGQLADVLTTLNEMSE